MAQLDTSRPLSQWSDDELLAYSILHPDTGIVPATNPSANVGRVASIAVGFPLAVLALGASLMWGFSGFSAKRP